MGQVLVACALLLSIAFSAAGATYYVDAAKGDDSNAGASADAAWKTLAKANAAVAPGDTVIVRAGVYADSQIRPARSGATGAVITYAAYEGETPEVTGGRYGSIVDLSGLSHITVKGFKIHSPAEHDWVVKMAGKDCRFNRILDCDVSDPQGYAPVVIAQEASHNEVSGCTVHDAGHGEEGSGDCIVINMGAHNNLVSANKCYNACHSQILVLSNSKNNVILNNDLYATDPKWSGAGVDVVLGADSNVIRGNRIHDLGAITDQKCAIQIDAADNAVDHNLIYNVANFGISLEAMRYGPEQQAAKNNIISNNTVYNTGRQPLVIVMKGALHATGNVYANNIVIGSPAKWYEMPAWTLIVDLYHLNEQPKPGTWYGNTFRNNAFWHEKAGEGGMVLCHGKRFDESYSIPRLEKEFPESWQGNFAVKPEFVAPEKGDFRLKPGSPLIDKSVDVSIAAGLPFTGHAADIGAVESPEIESTASGRR